VTAEMLEFPLDMDAREVAREVKRKGWYASGRQTMKVLLSGSSACGQKRETEGMMKPFASSRQEIFAESVAIHFDLAALASTVLSLAIMNNSAMSENAQPFGKVPMDSSSGASGCREKTHGKRFFTQFRKRLPPFYEQTRDTKWPTQ
jgi:hypothetical protein